MSTAIVSPNFSDYRDLLYKTNPLNTKSHMKSMLVDRKAVGAPLGYSLTSAASLRRSSTTSATLISASAFNFSTNKLNNSMLCLNESTANSNTTATMTTNNNLNTTSNCLPQQQQQTGHRKLDRSLSEPVNSAVGLLGIGLGGNQQQQQQQQPQGNSSRYKTELCRPFEESGTCKYGDKCQFAHGGHELRTLSRHPKYKTELCRTFHTTGFCPYGPRCHFIHNADESRKNSTSSNSTSPTPTSSSHCCSSSSSTSSTGTSSGSYSPPPHFPNRTRDQSFSLGSAGSVSPPSSLGGSPSDSTGSLFEDSTPPMYVSSQPATPTANNAFTYSTQEFTSALIGKGCRGNFINNKLSQQQLYNRALNQLNLSNTLNNLNNYDSIMVVDSGNNDGANHFVLGAPNGNSVSGGSAGLASSTTAAGGRYVNNNNIIINNKNNNNANGRLTPPEAPASPISSDDLDNTLSGNTSPHDFNRCLRLPIFSQLSVCDDD